MEYGLTVVSPPSEQPVTVAEAKLWLRQDLPHDDDLIGSLIKAATDRAELETRRAFVTRTYELTLDGFPQGDLGLVLPRPPLVAVDSVTYVSDPDGVLTAFADYAVDTTREPGWLLPAYDEDWPDDVREQSSAITIRYRAGYGTAADVPEGIKTAVKLTLAHWYEYRVRVHVGAGTPQEMPAGAQALLAGYFTGEYP